MTRCRHRLPDPATAGYTTLEALRAAAARSPDLRPCPRHTGSQGTWNWIERKHCQRCPDKDVTPPEAMPPAATPSKVASPEAASKTIALESQPSEVTPHVRKA